MKLTIVLFILTLINFTVSAQNEKGFVLEGEISDLKDGTYLYLISFNKDTAAHTTTFGSRFKFTGYVEGKANYYYLKIDSSISRQTSNVFWLVNTKMHLSGTLKEFKKLHLSGSTPHNDYSDMLKLQSDTSVERRIANMKKYILGHSNSLYVPRAIIKMPDYFNKEEMKVAYERLSKESRSTYWGNELYKVLSADTSTISIGIGKKISDFKVTNSNGIKVSILELVSKSDYTLIDFWASWCSPCRAEIPNLKKVYNDFHHKGFNIIGVSTDKSLGAWKKAIQVDETPWVHVVDNVENVTTAKLKLIGIPGYLLLDKHGNIIKFNLYSSIEKYEKNTASLTKDLYEIVSDLCRQ